MGVGGVGLDLRPFSNERPVICEDEGGEDQVQDARKGGVKSSIGSFPFTVSAPGPKI